MSSPAITKLFSEAIRAAIPDGALTVSAHADAKRVMSPERTNTAERGERWKTETVPHLREIMDCFTQADCREITLDKSSQIAGTELINNCFDYLIDIDPGPALYLAEDEGKAKAWKKECFDLMVRDNDHLRGLVSDGRGRRSDNTQLGAKFPGGRLNVAWASSPATVSSRPCQYVFIDERDAMAPTPEGDGPALAVVRTKTFRLTKKIIRVSSPRNRLENPPDVPPDTPRRSYIEIDYHNGDRRQRWIPCPHCDELQVLAFFEKRCSCPPRDSGPCPLKHGFVKWDEDPKSAYYVCVNGCVLEDRELQEALHSGKWIAEREFAGHASFWINELYSTFSSLGDIAEHSIRAKSDPSGEAWKVFLNTALAEAYEEKDDEIETDDLLDLQQNYDPTTLPPQITILVASVDVQKDRLEREIKGYGISPDQVDDPKAAPQCWGIDYHTIEGDPTGPEVWEQLRTLTAQPFKTEDGRTLQISATVIDTGYLAHHVYRFIRQNRGRRFYAGRGAHTPGKPLISKPIPTGKPPVRVWRIGTETAKDSIANRLELKADTPGSCHFAAHYPEHYFKQLRAEHPVTRYHRGRAFRCWEKIKDWYRNEALDLFVYCEAALAIALLLLKTNFTRLEKKAAAFRTQLAAEALNENTPPAPLEPPQPPDPEDLDDDDDLQVTIRTRRRRFVPGRRGNFVTD